jgi:hypothetical protein
VADHRAKNRGVTVLAGGTARAGRSAGGRSNLTGTAGRAGGGSTGAHSGRGLSGFTVLFRGQRENVQQGAGRLEGSTHHGNTNKHAGNRTNVQKKQVKETDTIATSSGSTKQDNQRPGAWLRTEQVSAVFPLTASMYFPAGQEAQERDPVADTFPASQDLHAASFMPPVISFSFRCLLASASNNGKQAHTRGVQELSSSTGDACGGEHVVVLGTVNIADDAFDEALVVASVVRAEKT